jgi:rhamnosyltransferase subunit B
MKIMLVVLGSAGDIFPLIGIGRALQIRRHHVELASTADYAATVRRSGLPFHELQGVPGIRNVPDLYHPTRSMRILAERLWIPAVKAVYELLASLDAREWAVIATSTCYGARIAQEKLGFRLTTCVISPFSLRSVDSMPTTPGISCPSWAPMIFRRAFFAFVSKLWDRALGPSINEYRRTLGLGGVRNIWYDWCLSPDRVIGLFPEWFVPRPPDWPRQFVNGGFTVFDQGEGVDLPAELQQAGDPMVIFAAGSAGEAAASFFRDAISASAGQPWRAVLLTGNDSNWAGGALPANVHRYNYVPLSQLLSRTAVVVHHGGLGTIALALAAAVPQIVIPFGHDQFDNAVRIEQLGAGRRLLKADDRARRLRSAIAELLRDSTVNARCRELAAKAAVDQSLVRVCEQIESDHQSDQQGTVNILR